ncbi:MAG: lysophospholipid acyltransferase family protein [Brevinematia bacterium]
MKKKLAYLMKILFTVYLFLALIPLTIIFGILGITLTFFSRNLAHYVEKMYFNTILTLTFTRVEISGLENLESGKNYIVTANHQSAFDILVLSAKLPLQIRWVSKESVFRIPIIGQFMRLMGYIPIPREKLKESVSLMKKMATKTDGSPTIFPEGTRSEDGRLQKFKRGFVILARTTKLDVLPVVIKGTIEIMRKGSLLVTPFRSVKVKILSPISNEEVTNNEEIINELRRIYLVNLEQENHQP